MIQVDVPGFGHLSLSDLVLDYNGTLALDGTMIPGVASLLQELSRSLKVHVITADTFGQARASLSSIPCDLVILGLENQDTAKKAFVEKVGASRTVSIGNGRNDRLMLEASALGIAVIQAEGAFSGAILSADAVFIHITHALELLLNPKRLIATLRS